MDKILPTNVRLSQPINHFVDDDFIDRLNSRWTVRVLMICIMVITGNIFVGKQINCWTPGKFR